MNPPRSMPPPAPPPMQLPAPERRLLAALRAQLDADTRMRLKTAVEVEQQVERMRRVRLWRKDRYARVQRLIGRWTVVELARKVKLADDQLSRILRGLRSPSYRSFCALGRVLGISLDDLADYLDEVQANPIAGQPPEDRGLRGLPDRPAPAPAA